jgi:iron complex transport system substrate-binding protein
MESTMVAYPEVSREGLLHLDPDVVFDLLPDLEDRHIKPEVALADWQGQLGLRALREGRIHPVEEPWVVVPGPRIADLVELFARLLHPEVGR